MLRRGRSNAFPRETRRTDITGTTLDRFLSVQLTYVSAPNPSTGEMKTRKRAGEKMNFLPAFFCFPRMHSIRWAVVHRQPVDIRQCRSRSAILLSSFARSFLPVDCFIGEIVCKCTYPCPRDGSRDAVPCGGGGGKAPPSFPLQQYKHITKGRGKPLHRFITFRSFSSRR